MKKYYYVRPYTSPSTSTAFNAASASVRVCNEAQGNLTTPLLPNATSASTAHHRKRSGSSINTEDADKPLLLGPVAASPAIAAAANNVTSNGGQQVKDPKDSRTNSYF